jgi:molecular chaperone GrpE
MLYNTPNLSKGGHIMAEETKEELQQEEQEQQVEAQEQEEVENSDTDTSIEEELEAYKAQAQEYKDKYLRAYADFENAKKRLEKDKANAVSYANESFAKDILAVMDSFDNALASIKEANEDNAVEVLDKMKEGVELTYNQLKKILEKNHIKEIECCGEFNPEVHQAIMQVDSDEHESGHIVQVMQKGYTIKDRVLRPAMISTAK